MTDRATFETRLTEAFSRYVVAAPADVDPDLVAQLVALPRRRWASRIGGRSPLRIALIAIAVIAALVGTMVVGSRLLERVAPRPFRSDRASFVALAPVPDRMDVSWAKTLPDGRVVLAGTQFDLARVAATAMAIKVWDPNTGGYRTYPRTSDVPIGDIVPLADGRVLVIDGWAGPFRPIASTEIFDPRSGAYAPSGALSAARLNFAAIRLTDGRVLVTGGEPPEPAPPPGNDAQGEPALSSTELFDPLTGRFTAGPPMTSGRENHAMTLLADGRVLVIGGIDGDQPSSKLIQSAEIFDPASNTFARTGSMRQVPGLIGPPAVRLADGRVLVIEQVGDREASFDAVAHLARPAAPRSEIYDPGSGIFAAGPAIPYAVTTATLLDDGFVLLTGASWESHQAGPHVSTANQDRRDYAWAAVLDPQTLRLRDIPPPAGASTSLGAPQPHAIRLADGRILLVEGWDSNDPQSPEGAVAVFQVVDR